MDASLHLQLLAVGASVGCVYALVALGFLLIYNGVGGLNFSQGDFVMIGAFAGVSSFATLGVSPWLALLATCVAMGLVGYVLYRAVFKPVQSRPIEVFIIATVGVSIALTNVAQIIWGPAPRTMPSLAGQGTYEAWGIVVPTDYVVVILVGAVALIFSYVFFMHTFIGRQLRAIATDRQTAELLGVNVSAMSAVAFILSGVMTGVAGCLIAPLFYATPTMGLPFGIKAFVAIVIGGFGNMVGAVVGGLIVGLLESYISYFVSTEYRDAIIFGILIAVLLVMPSGLFGERVEEKV